MIKTDREIWANCTLETPQDSCEYCNPHPIRYFNEEKKKVWVDRDELIETIKAFTIQMHPSSSKRGYINADLLLKELGVDEE